MCSESALAAPTLLIAMPQVTDSVFHRSVVFLAHHDDEGSLGFIVNLKTDLLVQEILEGMEIPWQGDDATMVFRGGPVRPQLGTVFYRVEPDDPHLDRTTAEASPGVGMSQHIGDLERLAADPPEDFRLILGYAGWGPGQLIDEILRNDWLTAPVDPELLFGSQTDAVWERAVRSVGMEPANLPSWTPGGGAGDAN